MDYDREKWHKLKHEAIFNPKDLVTDRIEKELNESFTFDREEYRRKLKADGTSGGNVSIGPWQFGGELKGSYSKDEFESLLKQHAIEAQWEGDRIIVKKIWLQVVNMGDFTSDAVISNRRLFVGGKEIEFGMVDVRPSQTIRQGAVHKDLAGRIAELESLLPQIERNKQAKVRVDSQIVVVCPQGRWAAIGQDLQGSGIDQNIVQKIMLQNDRPQVESIILRVVEEGKGADRTFGKRVIGRVGISSLHRASTVRCRSVYSRRSRRTELE